MIDHPHMTDQVLMIGHKVEKDLIAETEAEIEW